MDYNKIILNLYNPLMKNGQQVMLDIDRFFNVIKSYFSKNFMWKTDRLLFLCKHIT